MTQTLLTVEDVLQWKARIEEIVQETHALKNERDALEKKLAAVEVIFGSIPKVGAPLSHPLPIAPPDVSARRIQEAPREHEGERDSWPVEILKIFEPKRGPLSYEQLKSEVKAGHLQDEFAKSEKGYYHGISRLLKRGQLAKHKGWLIRPEDLQAIKSEVLLGLRSEIPEFTATRVSPMAEAIKGFLADNSRGVGGGEVIAHLKSDDRFRDTLLRNATGGYNVLGRLLDRGEITKEGKLYYPLEAFADHGEE